MKTYSNFVYTGDGLKVNEPVKIEHCLFTNITNPQNPEIAHGIEFTGNGEFQTEPSIVNACVFDNTGIKSNTYDEGVALCNAPFVIFNRCRFKGIGKAALIGNGDHPIEDKNLHVIFNECIFEENSRRSPYIQYGHAELNSCLIKNWGNKDAFYLKSFGLRIGNEAECYVKDTIFWQDHFWPGLKNFISDVCNQYKPILIPGNFRGAYAEDNGKLTLEHCYKNHPLIWLQGENYNPMTKKEALEQIDYLESVVPTKESFK